MQTGMTIQLENRLNDLIRYIQYGRILEAMNEFYASDVKMQENNNPPTVGLVANIEREKRFLSSIKEWKGFEVKAFAAGPNVTFYEAVLDWIGTDGRPVHLEQVAVAHWRDGAIVHERFFYDTGMAFNS